MKTSRVPFTTLLAGLADPNGQVRRKSITAIMRRRSERGQAVAALLALLNDPEDEVCEAAIKALGTLGDPQTFPFLVQVFTCYSSHARPLALKTLVHLDYTQAMPYLLTGIGDGTASVRRVTSRALEDARVIGALIATLGHADANIRRSAAAILGGQGDARAVDPLIAILHDEDTAVRRVAAQRLGELGDARAVEPLIAALGDASESVRRHAARALGRLGDAHAVTPLIAALADVDGWVRAFAAWALGILGDTRAVEPLIAALSNADRQVRYGAAASLGALGDPRALLPLRTLLADTDSDVAQQAKKATAQLESLQEAL